MKLIQKLDNNLLTGIIVLLVSLLGFAITGYLLTGVHKDIPLGFVFAGGVISLLHVISSILLRIDEKRGSSVFSIISIMMRLMVLLAVLIVVVLMSYRWNLVLFNIFVFVGVYTLSVIVYMLMFVLRKNRKE